jgi:hypothetical protein
MTYAGQAELFDLTGNATVAITGTMRVQLTTFEVVRANVGPNRELMTVLQLFAARLAGVARVRFYAFDDAGRAAFERGQAALERALANTTQVADVIERLDAAGYVWGVSNGT